MNHEMMQIVRSNLVDELILKVKGHVECWYTDNTIHIKITNHGIVFTYDITDVLNLLYNGVTASDLAYRVMITYKSHMLNMFFI